MVPWRPLLQQSVFGCRCCPLLLGWRNIGARAGGKDGFGNSHQAPQLALQSVVSSGMCRGMLALVPPQLNCLGQGANSAFTVCLSHVSFGVAIRIAKPGVPRVHTWCTHMGTHVLHTLSSSWPSGGCAHPSIVQSIPPLSSAHARAVDLPMSRHRPRNGAEPGAGLPFPRSGQ